MQEKKQVKIQQKSWMISIFNDLAHRRENPEALRNQQPQNQHQHISFQIPRRNVIQDFNQSLEINSEDLISNNNIQEQMNRQQANFQGQDISDQFLKKLSIGVLYILENSGTISRKNLIRELCLKLTRQRRQLNTAALRKNVSRRLSDTLAVLKSINLIEQYKKQKVNLITLLVGQNKKQPVELNELKKEIQEKTKIMLQKTSKLDYFQEKIQICRNWQNQNCQHIQNELISNDQIVFPSLPTIFIAYNNTISNPTDIALLPFKNSSQISSIKFKSSNIQLISSLDAVKCLMNIREQNNQEDMRQRYDFIDQCL